MVSNVTQQQVLEGYKQTEIGVIPDDWGVEKVASLCSITTGNKNTQDKINDGLYPFFVRSQTVERINSYSFDGEAVLTAGDGVGTGKIFHYIDGRCDIHQRVYKMSGFHTNLDGFYFYKYFSSRFYDRIISMTAKSSVDSVRLEMIANMYIAVPPINEQTAIANALSDIDALISSLEKLIAKKRDIKTATMQQLLTGKKRLPPFDQTHTGYKQTELGEIPRDWMVKTVSQSTVNIIDYRGVTPKKLGMDWGGGDIVALSAGNVKKGYIDFNEESYLGSEKLYKHWMRNGHVQKGDVVITMEAPLGNVAIIPDDRKYIMSQRTILLQFDLRLAFGGYLFQYFLSSSFQSRLCDRATGSTAQGIKRTIFELLELPLPSIDEQKLIANALLDIDKEIDMLQQRLNKTRQFKQGMMQELLTGKTRLI